jgi:hypothetical protein
MVISTDNTRRKDIEYRLTSKRELDRNMHEFAHNAKAAA